MENFKKYFEEIGLSEHFLQRTLYILKLYENLGYEKIIDVFVSEYQNEDGSRNYENLWMFSKNFVSESKNFLVRDNLDSTSYLNRMEYWEITLKEFDFKKPTSKSRFTLRAVLKNEVKLIFRASGNNCQHLNNIFDRFIKPNLIPKR